MTGPRGLHTLARLHGVQTAYHDNGGRRIVASPDSLMAALRALRVPVRDASGLPRLVERRRRELWERVVEPVVVAWLPAPGPGPVAAARGDDPARSFLLRLPVRLRDAPIRVVVRLEGGGERSAAPDTAGLEVVEIAEVAGLDYIARDVPLPAVPSGYHELHVEVGAGPARQRHRALLIAAPRRAAGWEVLPGPPDWGLFAPLYAVWEDGARPTPNEAPHFGLLDSLAGSAARHGGTVIGTLPLLAAFLGEPYEPSPYAPVSRLFWNELYVRPDAEVRGPGLPELREVSGAESFDPRATMAVRRRALEREARAFFARTEPDGPGVHPAGPAPVGGGEPDPAARTVGSGSGPEGRSRRSGQGDIGAMDRPNPTQAGPGGPGMAGFRARNPRAWDYARFRALVEAHGVWQGWPDRLRARDVRPEDYDPAVARYHLYAQWRAEGQLAGAQERATARGVSLYLDLPLGVHPGGYDVWRDRSLFALDARAGAPPDPLAEGGQDWGFHPPHPETGRLEGHRYFIESIRHHLRFAGVLRVDHVMQLHRLFWVVGADARDGVYVRYPHEELYAILSLESHRAGAVIVGEDLGTVPQAVRRGMRRHGLPGMYVVEFELEDREAPGPGTGGDGLPALAPRPVPAGALASIGTHDTPTFAAWWSGRDAEIRGERGLADQETVRAEVAGRAEMREKLARGLGVAPEAGGVAPGRAGAGWRGDAEEARAAPAERAVALAVQEALLRRLGRSRAGLVLAALEDLWLETEPQNVPGTTTDTNWRRRARRSLAALEDPDAVALLRALNEARKGIHE
jgi:4-alpha-glucanotransferase